MKEQFFASDAIIQTPGNQPVAIIGMSCRFPGAQDLESFWQLLCSSGDAITEVPASRFDVRTFYSSRPATPGKMITRWGGFLEDIDQFDSSFFSITPREAARVDPQVRLLLEVAWEALEDAGEVPEALAGSQTGVFIGETYNDYEDLQFHDPQHLDIYTLTGSVRAATSGKIARAFDLRGPSLTVDTACSSSLVAVHLACQSLWQGESRVALAGGVNLILQPEASIGFSQAGMLAPDGRCKTFDARADGFVRSEGVGIVVLKPLAQARADGNPIYAVIRGSVVNNDGRSSESAMIPSREGQERMLREAYRCAGVAPGLVQYVEAHGTGTSVGDPIEVAALAAVLADGRQPGEHCLVGSVKTNIGHTEGAAGIAGLIKTALCLKYRAIPASLHVQTLSPRIPWSTIPLEVAREFKDWPTSTRTTSALAGVSSFGITGTNAHVVLEGLAQCSTGQCTATDEARAQLLPLSAHTPSALRAVAQNYRSFFHALGEKTSRLADICYTASTRRTHHSQRLALVANSIDGMIEHLDNFLNEAELPTETRSHEETGVAHKLVFVFPGQGSQWLGMGRELFQQEPVFRESLERCEQAMRSYVDWSLLEQLTADEAHTRLGEIDCIQPVLFAIQVALAELWRSWGIVPDAVIGHSMGEIAAAYVAGALSLDDAARVICRRSALLKRVSGKGGMAVVGLSLEQARQVIAEHGYAEHLAIAVSNSPDATVLSGDLAALEAVLSSLQRQDIFCRFVKVDVASHSPQMDCLLDELSQILCGLQPRPALIPIYSTVTASIAHGSEMDAAYWVSNLRESVLFAPSIRRLLADGHDTFVEISPHPILLSSIQQCLQHSGYSATTLASLRRAEDERASMLEACGSLYMLGFPIAWQRLHTDSASYIRLPAYPWQREYCWISPPDASGRASNQSRGRSVDGRPAYPLLQQYFRAVTQQRRHFWETELDTGVFAYLNDHRVQSAAVFPAAAYIGMALAAAAEIFDGPTHLEDIQFSKALFLQSDSLQKLQLMLDFKSVDSFSFQFFTPPLKEQESATLHTSGVINLRQGDAGAAEEQGFRVELAALQQRCQEVVEKDAYYQWLQGFGLMYGPCFQGVQRIWRGDGEALALVELTSLPSEETADYQLHPALLDSCFQALVAALPTRSARGEEEETYLPVSLQHFQVINWPGSTVWGYARLRSGGGKETNLLKGDVFLLDTDGQALASARGLCLQRIQQASSNHTLPPFEEWFHEIQWELTPLEDSLPPSVERQALRQGRWLILSDRGGVGDALAALLTAAGQHCITVYPEAGYQQKDTGTGFVSDNSVATFTSLLNVAQDPDQLPLEGIIHLWSLGMPDDCMLTGEELLLAQEPGCVSALHLVQALATVHTRRSPRLLLVTRATQPAGEATAAWSPAQAPLWGLGRTIFYEHPELRCQLIDLSVEGGPDEIEALFHEIQADVQDEQVALRGTQRYVARLVQRADRAGTQQPLDAGLAPSLSVGPDHPFRVEIATPGILDNLRLYETTRSRPQAGEVEIQVYAAGLNFHDVMLAMGIDIGETHDGPIPLGLECAGVITSLGAGVEHLRVGDAVVALTPFSLGTYVIAPAELVVLKPAHLSFEEAATIPAAFLTAYYALYHLGHIAPGERVLIHSATGGVGMAAIQLAQLAGAEIFATAGTPEKRALLLSLGIKHVMDSRSLAFVEEVQAQTNNCGVDLVLNSLAGEALLRSFALLGPYGRFLEIGKRDIFQGSQLDLKPFQKSLSFFSIDLDRLAHDRPLLLGTLLQEVMQLFVADKLKPLPYTVFPIEQVSDAFRYMAQAGHTGKIVLSPRSQEVSIIPALHASESSLLQTHATYMITGGLGGLGLAIGDWLTRQGAQHLVLLGRRAPSPAAQQAIAAMEERGAHVVVMQADITQETQVTAVLEKIARTLPPLHGVIHGAAVLDDGTLLQLDRSRLLATMAPKMLGAWYLHKHTQHLPLDFFVLFSSVAGLLGSPGQGNYSAGNTFLDALAHARRAQGLPALCVNWGPWAEIGLAASQSNRGQRLSYRGLGAMPPEQALKALALLLSQDIPQVTVTPFDLEQWRQFYPVAKKASLFAHLACVPASEERLPARSLRDDLLAAAPEERLRMIKDHLSNRLVKILGFKQERPDLQKPLNRLGIDSLMAIELRNAIEADFGVSIPVVDFLKGNNLSQLAQSILEQLPTTATSTVPDDTQEQTPPVSPGIDQLSNQEVEVLLKELLAESSLNSDLIDETMYHEEQS